MAQNVAAEEKVMWLLDSGCFSHMTGRKEFFHWLNESVKQRVRMGDDSALEVQGKGCIAIQMPNRGRRMIYGVKYVPNLAYNLLSVGQLINNGYKLVFEKRRCCIHDTKSGEVFIEVFKDQHNLFPIELSHSEVMNAVVGSNEEVAYLWHRRYGHLNFQGLQF
ncbi:RNA-directed DNA polymerase protein [Dioscorea alata]|uniref:RNA-directed DNA polymerase protein n=1 Tax=Dioscorea alata TaxID=55571 RepID=A0ACB7WBT9_DIOAL|nr:RNA-directed DNA polymerase protein [Dioscorea alata]